MNRYEILRGVEPPPRDKETEVVYHVNSNGLCNALAELLPDQANKKVMDILREHRFFAKLGKTKVYDIYQADMERPVQAPPVRQPTMMGVALNFTEADLTLSIDQFQDRYIRSAAQALQRNIDTSVIDWGAVTQQQDILRQTEERMMRAERDAYSRL